MFRVSLTKHSFSEIVNKLKTERNFFNNQTKNIKKLRPDILCLKKPWKLKSIVYNLIVN